MELIAKQPTATGPADWFTGAVYINQLVAAEAPARLRAGLVRFTPGARTHWHRHSLGQTLHIVSGIALVGTRDGTVIEARPGDTVWTPKGEEHWHGATGDQFMAHLAMWEDDDVTWNEAVTDADYRRGRTLAH
ncbi:cupin domain-containing protein [Glycomyces mayteni]|uniref:Cupin domain-containing protein n=1 Tax=Glycomyces mayteni TaxID=543887 RepID=A0ABW2DAB4_9ACTN|nr:cupin domain-containing protein [Glycomyces mayteni]